MHKALQSIDPLGFRLPPGRGKLSSNQRAAITRKFKSLRGLITDPSKKAITPRKLKGETQKQYNARISKLKEETGTPKNIKKVFVPVTKSGQRMSLKKGFVTITTSAAKWRDYVLKHETISQMANNPEWAPVIISEDLGIALEDERFSHYVFGNSQFETFEDMAESVVKSDDWYLLNRSNPTIRAFYKRK